MSSLPKIRRLLRVLELLQSGSTHNAPELAALCGASKRTIFRDLKLLQDSGVAVLYDQHRQGYRLASQSYLPPSNLTLRETLALILIAREAGHPSRGIPFQQTARDAALKLQSNLPSHLYEASAILDASVQIDPVDATELAHAQSHYEQLLTALGQKRQVRMRYHSLAEEADIQTRFSPYRLLFRRHAWYAVGRSSLHRAVRTFHVGRILDLETTEDSYTIPQRFSLKRYFGKAWNLVRERNARTQVRIRFQPLVASNVEEVNWHSTQKTHKNPDGTLDFTVTVDGIHEISWWILGYGDQAEVLEPEPLRELIEQRARKLLSIYERPAATNVSNE